MIGQNLVALWHKLPVLLRSVLAGFFVFLLLQAGWNVFLVLNLSLSPAIPWAAPLTLLYLWVVFKHFNGSWRPRATSDARRESMRARRLTGDAWKSALVACVPVLIFFVCATMVSYRLVDIPADDTAMPDMPWWSLYSTLLMVAVVAGVAEEAGFRGYMQAPLEKRYGPVVAIAVTSVLFWVAHLNHSSGVGRLPALVTMGASLGALAYCARSILPAIIVHASADAIVFIGATAGIGPDSLWNPTPLKESGVDGFFYLMVTITLVSGVAMVHSLRRLARVVRAASG